MTDLSMTEQKEQTPKSVIIPQETAVALANGLKHIFTPEELENIVYDLKKQTGQSGAHGIIMSMMEEKAGGINQFIADMGQAETVTMQPFQGGWEIKFSDKKDLSGKEPPPGEIIMNPVLASLVTRALDHHIRNQWCLLASRKLFQKHLQLYNCKIGTPLPCPHFPKACRKELK